MPQKLPRESKMLYDIAHRHYVEGLTMESIANELRVSRSTVSRFLKRAREVGVVRITVTEPARTDDRLTRQLSERFDVNAQVVSVRGTVGEVNRLEHVARVAAQAISETVSDGMSIGCAWGTTMASVVRYLHPRRSVGVKIVQMNGGANPRTSGIPYVGQMITQFAHAFSAETVLFPVPTFFDRASTREAMWAERSIKPLVAEQRDVDVAVFGVGSITGPVSSHVYVSGYLDVDDMAALARERVVGDVCTVFLREDGSWRDIELNSRATGLNPAELGQIERRICIAAGSAKTAAVLGAMRAGVATDLVVDEALARTLLKADDLTSGVDARP